MDILGLLITNLLPLYLIIGLGYIAGRHLDVKLHSLAIIAIYILAPVVNFGAVARLEFRADYILLPFLAYGIAVICALSAYRLSSLAFRDNAANLIGLASGTGNTGYFGLPLVLALFDPAIAGIYLLMNFGIVFNESTLSYYLGARGQGSVLDSVKKLLKLPILYALLAGLAVNLGGLALPDIFYTYWNYFTGAWVIIGMMLIGVALSKMESFHLNPKLLGWLFAFKFILWPGLAFAFIYADRTSLQLFDQSIHTLIWILSIVPLAGNTVAFAAQLNVRPADAATAVLLSTLFALIYIPAMFMLFV